MLTRRDLDAMRCSKPGCECGGALVLRSRCHPRAATWATYNQAIGGLVITCCLCGARITTIAVAQQSDPVH